MRRPGSVCQPLPALLNSSTLLDSLLLVFEQFPSGFDELHVLTGQVKSGTFEDYNPGQSVSLAKFEAYVPSRVTMLTSWHICSFSLI